MNDNDKTKLVINIGAVRAEGEDGPHTMNRVLNMLKALRDDLNSQGVDTTITVAGIDIKQFESHAGAPK